MGRSSSARDSSFAVIVRGGRILLVLTKAGRWQLPGGRLRRGEGHRAGLRREVHEETGLRVDVGKPTGAYPRKDGSRAVVFLGDVPPRAEPRGPRNEIREQRWVGPRLARRFLKKKARRRLADALSAASGRKLREAAGA